jgi:hypothetical protein
LLLLLSLLLLSLLLLPEMPLAGAAPAWSARSCTNYRGHTSNKVRVGVGAAVASAAAAAAAFATPLRLVHPHMEKTSARSWLYTDSLLLALLSRLPLMLLLLLLLLLLPRPLSPRSAGVRQRHAAEPRSHLEESNNVGWDEMGVGGEDGVWG